MKKLLLSVSVLALLPLLLVGTGMAEPTHPNELGLYTTSDGNGPTGTFLLMEPVTVYLVLTKPADTQNGDAPYPDVNAFECRINFDPVPNNDLLLLSTVLPPTAIDIGLNKDINQGYLDFVVGIGSSVPVVDEAVVLATLTFLNLNPANTVVFLGPTEPQSIAGQMAFQAEVGELRVMYSVGGSHMAGVFEFNGEAVAVENESFGSVKALYR